MRSYLIFLAVLARSLAANRGDFRAPSTIYGETWLTFTGLDDTSAETPVDAE